LKARLSKNHVCAIMSMSGLPQFKEVMHKTYVKFFCVNNILVVVKITDLSLRRKNS